MSISKQTMALLISQGDQIQVKTKTDRHQLAGIWLTVESARPGSATVSAKTPDGGKWRIPRGMVKTIKHGGTRPQPDSGVDATFAPVGPAAIPDVAKLEARIAQLESTVTRLEERLTLAIANLDDKVEMVDGKIEDLALTIDYSGI